MFEVLVLKVSCSRVLMFHPCCVGADFVHRGALSLEMFLLAESNHIFRVLCKDLGEQELIVTVQNGITSKNKFPAKATSSVR